MHFVFIAALFKIVNKWRQPFPQKAKSPWGKPGTGVLTAADLATHLSITSVKAFWILLNQRDKDRVQRQPRGPLPSYGYNHSPTKIQPHLYGQNRALSHMLQIVLVVRTQNKKLRWAEKTALVFSQLSSKHESQQGQREMSYRTMQKSDGRPTL